MKTTTMKTRTRTHTQEYKNKNRVASRTVRRTKRMRKMKKQKRTVAERPSSLTGNKEVVVVVTCAGSMPSTTYDITIVIIIMSK